MKKFGLVLLVVLAVCSSAFSQAPADSTATSATPFASSPTIAPARVITLGNSIVMLDGEWKFQPGDSPWVDGSPVWAQPGFDDAHWATLDLTPKAGAVDLVMGTTGFVPGWTRRGYPNLDGYAWYRLRLRVTNPGQPLRLKMPIDFDDAYQVYANGHYVGQFGGFSQNGVTLYYSEAVSYTLPSPGPDGEIDLAVRLYMSPSTRFGNPDVGGMHGPPALGLASTVHLLQAADEEAQLRHNFALLLRAFLFLLVAPLALWAWLRNRQERAWLWLSLALVSTILLSLLSTLASMTTRITLAADMLFDQTILFSLLLPLWAMFWWQWFGLREKRWIPRVLWLLTAAEMLTTFLVNSPYLGLSLVPQAWLPACNTASIWCNTALGLLLLVILVEGFRRDRTEALLAAPPILLLEFTLFQAYLLASFDIPGIFFPFGLGISIGNIASMLMLLVVGALAMRRFLRTQVSEELARQTVAKDMEQAQQLQQRVLIPEAIASPNFTVETEYRPAQTVGGDFFQTLSRPDGSLLVVIGDVSGKGISAAMLVAVLVGTIRTRADESFDPASMLATLNHRMIGRSGGHFATCLAAEITPDGTMHIANAGHLPPYLNGKEMDLEGSLPLGAIAEIDASVETFTLHPGDHLTFMTDGVVEAISPAKELFGFDRAQAISSQRAAAIAQQAQTFGQEDDITVLSVAYAGGVPSGSEVTSAVESL